jgi:hypothetical protein
MLIEKLAQTEWYKNLPFTRKPMVNLIRPEQVQGVKDRPVTPAITLSLPLWDY